MKNISLIIPIYNGSKYIIRCLESIKNQTYQEFEIILINDGSTDNSLQLIQNYKEKYKEKLDINIHNQKNSGIAISSNNGILYSKGNYIVFLDQDDYIDKDFLEILFEKIHRDNLDIVVTGYRRVTIDGKVERRVPILYDDEWGKFLNVAPWGKIYRKSFILDNKLFFLNVIKGEDVYFTVNSYVLTKKIVTLPYIGYNWVDNISSVSNTLHTEIKNENSIMPLFFELKKSLQGQKLIPPEILKYFFIMYSVYEILYCARSKKRKDVINLYDKMIDWLDKYFPGNLHNRYIKLWRPKSEIWYTRIIIRIFWILRRIHLAKLFLIIYAKIF